MSIVRKPDLVAHLGNLGFTQKDANLAIDEIFGFIESSIADGATVKLTGFGTFDTYERAGGTREVFGAVHEIAAKTLPKFKPGKRLRDAAAAS